MQEQLIKFYHETMLSPVKNTLIEAARCGYLPGWLGLTQAAIKKNLDVDEATVKGHLNQVRQGIQSTQENIWSQKARKNTTTTKQTTSMPL
eukprot:962828-Ditylum_brightwellii.AAC.1